MFEIIKRYYQRGLYSEADLDVFVAARYITVEQKIEIMES